MVIFDTSNNPKNTEELDLFKDTFLKHYDALCSYAFKYVRSFSISEDIVQDIFYELWKKRKDIDLTIPLKPLLYRLIKNRSIDYLRKVQYEEDKLKAIDPLDHYVRNMIINQEDDFHLNQLKEEITTGIKLLPEQCKRVFILSRFDGLKNKEIAEQLDISIKTVEKHISKAIMEIRHHLLKKDLLKFIFILCI